MSTNTRRRDEVLRQQKYLAGLPEDFTFPLFNAKTALESQRRSGYQNTAAAGREIVDNAIEAGATAVHVAMEGHKSVDAVAFIDNGAGMIPAMIRAALSWGGGTRFEEHDFIGKFGFGLPNASINQTRRVEVYSRTASAEQWHMSFLDIGHFNKYGVQSIPAPEKADLPAWVKRYMKKHGIALDSGTVVVWVKPDRLTYRSASYLKRHMVDDFGVVYRYLLKHPDPTKDSRDDAPEVFVDGLRIEPVDPLFLDPSGRYFVPPAEDKEAPSGGGARLIDNRLIPVKYFADPETGERHLRRVAPDEVIDTADENLLAVGTIAVKVARFPVGFVWGSKKSAPTPEAHLRFQIRKPRRGISFVRARREIETVDAFPKSDRDRESGLGDWPLLQGYAYHWGVELSFQPDLDEAFGITNDKQSVRPMEDLWRVLASEGVDALLKAENTWQTRARDALKEQKAAERTADPTPAEKAAQAADTATGRRPTLHGSRKEQAEKDIQAEAQHRAEQLGRGVDEVKKALEEEAKKHRYKVEFFENDYAPFFEPEYRLGQMIVKINKKHPFYQALYAQVDGTAARDAVDLLLIALARAEITVDDEDMMQWYPAQRIGVWSPFLSDSLRILTQMERQVEEEVEAEDLPHESAEDGDSLSAVA